MQKVKVTCYVTGQRPVYAGESSSEEEEEDDLLVRRGVAEIQATGPSYMKEADVACCVCVCKLVCVCHDGMRVSVYACIHKYVSIFVCLCVYCMGVDCVFAFTIVCYLYSECMIVPCKCIYCVRHLWCMFTSAEW